MEITALHPQVKHQELQAHQDQMEQVLQMVHHH